GFETEKHCGPEYELWGQRCGFEFWFQVSKYLTLSKLFIFFFLLRQDLALSPRLEYNSAIIAPCTLDLLGSSNPPTSTSQISRTIGRHHHTQIIFNFFIQTVTCCVVQAGLELLASSHPPTLASQSAEITGMRHCVWPTLFIFKPQFLCL
uniref:Uncharacterized protein n=1 Tax=Macaca fascicularis TaxID=9541 RepID=A0A7N9D8R2_MACFA